MILPDFFLSTRANQCWDHSGIDSFEHCQDKNHYVNFSWPVIYNYNSRGYRDSEWPETLSELQKSIWCIGDSFTVGIGSPYEHTWPAVLQQTSGIRCINVSMDGASNQWIARKARQVIDTIAPAVLIVHWSYISRREKTEEESWQTFYKKIAESSWPSCSWKDRDQLPPLIKKEIVEMHGGWPDQFSDESRMIYATSSTDDEDVEDTLSCIHSLPSTNTTQIIHSFIPYFTRTPFLGKKIQSEISVSCIQQFEHLDWARDKHHYDIKTSRFFVEQIMQFLS
jgi:hypothetical protein